MKLEWRPVTLAAGYPEISTSLTLAETNELMRMAKDANVLEIGSAYGYSAVAMAIAGARVLAVDPHEWLNSHAAMVANLGTYGVAGNVTIVRGRSDAVLPGLVGRTFDLIWIDGDHEQAAIERDVELALPLLRPKTGVLACHDWDEDTCPGVRQALEAKLGRPHELVDTLAIYRGLS